MSRSIGRNAVAVWLAVAVMATVFPGGVMMAQSPTSAPKSSDRATAPTAEEAQELMQSGRFEEAAEVWGVITEQDPENGQAWFLRGYCLHAAGRLDEALEVHTKAATFDDFRGIALYNLACARALTGQPDAAFEALASAQASGFQLRGRAEQDPDFDSIKNDPRFPALIEQEPAGWRGRLQMALVQMQRFVQERAPQAKGLLQQAAARGRGMLAALAKKLASDERFAGIARKLQGSGASAGAEHGPGTPRETPSSSPTSGPRELQALMHEAQQHQRAGNWHAAAAVYQALTEAQPESAEAWFGLAYSIHASGDHQQAIKVHKKAATFERIKGISLYNLACAYAMTGRTDEAIEALAASKNTGFDIAPAASDSDLDSLRDDPRFIMLLTDGKL